MRIYTRAGDSGSTGLIGGRRVSKGDPVIEAIGSIDEVNAWLGVLASHVDDARVRRLLAQCQNDLFELGAELASPGGPPRLDPARVSELEKAIDDFGGTLPPLRRFVLPGGHPAAAWTHVARTVARRAERAVVRLLGEATEPSPAVRYLNRLSDLLFVLARLLNSQAGVPEPTWPGDHREESPPDRPSPSPKR